MAGKVYVGRVCTLASGTYYVSGSFSVAFFATVLSNFKVVTDD
jgi:hypothetical protein